MEQNSKQVKKKHKKTRDLVAMVMRQYSRTNYVKLTLQRFTTSTEYVVVQVSKKRLMPKLGLLHKSKRETEAKASTHFM